MKVETFGIFNVTVEEDKTLIFRFENFQFDFQGQKSEMADDEVALSAVLAVCRYMEEHARMMYQPCAGSA